MEKDRSATQSQQFIKELGENLRAARESAGMSLKDAGEFLGVSKAAVGHWETGTNPISIDKLFRLARKYKTTVSALVAGQMSNDDLAVLVARRLDAAPALATAAPAQDQAGQDRDKVGATAAGQDAAAPKTPSRGKARPELSPINRAAAKKAAQKQGT